MSYEQFSVVPYESLSFEQLNRLSAKGFTGQAAYEDTPLGGRIYDFGPKEAFAQMIQQFGMQVLFEEKLIRDEQWLEMWQEYQEDLNNNTEEPMSKIDEQEYFTVYMILLTMPDGDTQLVQLAARDFPPKADEFDALNHLVKQTKAQKGEILALTKEGYSPVGDIVKCL